MLSLDIAVALSATALAPLSVDLAARDDSVQLTADAPGQAQLLENDAGASLRILEIEGGAVGSVFTSPLGARVEVGPDGLFTYDPGAAFRDLPAGETRGETFRYVLGDGRRREEAVVNVSVRGTNSAPSAVGSGVSVAAVQGETITPITVAPLFSDAGDSLGFAVALLPDGVRFDAATGVVSGAPSAAGDWTSVVTATDSAGQQATTTLQFSVQAALRLRAEPPTLRLEQGVAMTPVDLKSYFESGGAQPVITLTSIDTPMPAGLTVTDGVLQGAPAAASGPCTLRLAAAASGSHCETQLTLSVDRPQLSGVAPRLALLSEIEPVSLALLFDGAPSRYEWLSGALPGVTLDPATGALSGVPQEATGPDGVELAFRAVEGEIGQAARVRVDVDLRPPSELRSRVQLYNAGAARITHNFDGSVDIISNGDDLFNVFWPIAPNQGEELELRYHVETIGVEGLGRAYDYNEQAFMVLNQTSPVAGPRNFYMELAGDATSARGPWIGVERPVMANNQGWITLSLKNFERGKGLKIREMSLVNPQKAPLVATGALRNLVLPPDREARIDLRRGFAGASALSLADGVTPPEGMALIDDVLTGRPSPGVRDQIAVKAVNRLGSAAQEQFEIAVEAGRYLYVSEVDGPHALRVSDLSGPAEARFSKAIPLADGTMRIARVSGATASAVWRASGLTKGGRYRLTANGLGRGNLAADAAARIRIGLSQYDTVNDWALDRRWTLDQPAPALEFVAPIDDPMIVIDVATPSSGVDVEAGEYFTLDPAGFSIAPVDPQDAPTPDGGVRVGPEVDVPGGKARRLFNLGYGARYDIVAHAPGAQRIVISHDESGEEKSCPTDMLGNISDRWEGSSASDAFLARDAIMWVVAPGASSLEVSLSAEPVAWPPAKVAAPKDAPFPFTEAYPPTPAGTVTVSGGGSALVDALKAATGGEVILVEPGVYDGGAVAHKRYSAPVLVVPTEQYAATVAALDLRDVRKLTLRGLVFDGSLTLFDVQDVTVEHNLFQSATALGQAIYAPIYNLSQHVSLLNNDIASVLPDSDPAKNSIMDAFGLQWTTDARVIGNRIRYMRADGMKVMGWRAQVEHNFIGDSATPPGAHADTLQIMPNDGRRIERLPNRFFVFRQNVIFDRQQAWEGSALFGVTTGNHMFGFRGLEVTDNIFDIVAPYAMDAGPGESGLVIERNSSRGQPFNIRGKGFDRFSGSVKHNIGRDFTVFTYSYAEYPTIADVDALDIMYNFEVRDHSVDTVWQNPNTLAGWKLNEDAAAAAKEAGGAAEFAGYLAERTDPLEALRPQDWFVEAGGGTLTITLRTTPRGGETLSLVYEVQLDDGAWQVLAVDPPRIWSASLPAASGVHRVTLRVSEQGGAAKVSAPKTASL